MQESDTEESEEEDEGVDANTIPGMDTNKSKKARIVEDKTFLKLTENCKTEKDVKKLVRLDSILEVSHLKSLSRF